MPRRLLAFYVPALPVVLPSMAHGGLLSMRSMALPELAPAGRSLLERSVFGGIPYWWFAHTRIGWLLYYHHRSGEEAVRARLGGGAGPGLALRVHALRGAFAGQRVPLPALPDHLAAPRRLLYVGQNRQWPDSDGAPRDRFFGDVVARLEGTLQAASTYPLTGGRYPWGPAREGVAVARARNDAPDGIPHLPADAVWSPAADRLLRQALRRFRREAEEIAEDWDAAVVPYERDARTRRLLLDIVLHAFQTVMPIAVLLTAYGQEVISRTRPHVVLLLNEYGFFERGLVQAAHEASVPTLAVQHGVLHPDHPGYVFPRPVLDQGRDGSDPLLRAPLPDRLVVYGEAYRKMLVDEVGWDPAVVEVTGHPKADHIARLGRAARAGHPSPSVLWLTQVHGLPPEENHKNEEVVVAALEQMPGSRLIIKPHPNDRPQDLPRPPPARLSAETLSAQHDVHRAILMADVAITKDSTTALEAMALGVPVVILNTTEFPDRIDYCAHGAALRAMDAPGLLRALQESLRDDPCAAQREAYVRAHLGPLDGQSVDRLAQVVTSLAASAKR